MSWQAIYYKALQRRFYFGLGLKCGVVGALLLLGLCAAFARPAHLAVAAALPYAQESLVTQEIHYHLPEAAEVFFVWGVDGWAVAPEQLWPPRTEVRQKVLYTPMTLSDDG